MERRRFLKTAGAATAGCVAAHALGAHADTQRKRPNIVFLFSDQQRWDTVGCYDARSLGAVLGVTPNLDAMAQEGVRFHHAFTCQPVCGPARSCLQTGLYATQTGCWRNDIALPLDAVTLPRLLKSAGYEAGYIGKWHLASTGSEVNHRTGPVPKAYRGGYDEFWLASDVLEFTSHGYDGHMFDADMNQVDFPAGRYRVDALTDFAVDYLRSRDGNKPFFLFLSYIEPHHQNDHNHFEGPKGSKERFKDFPVPGDLEGAKGNWKEELPDYLGCCAALDGAVGRIRGELDKLGIADNTLVIYTSDHACHFCTRNREHKRSCHDNSIRVPMILCGPGFRGGGVVQELVSLIELPPTVLAAGGVTPPAPMQGRPLQPLAAGQTKGWPEEVFVQISESQVGRAIRTSRWKYAVRAPGAFDGNHGEKSLTYDEDFLYDLEADPHERSNLVRDPSLAEVRSGLAKRLLARMRQAHEEEPEIRPAPKNEPTA